MFSKTSAVTAEKVPREEKKEKRASGVASEGCCRLGRADSKICSRNWLQARDRARAAAPVWLLLTSSITAAFAGPLLKCYVTWSHKEAHGFFDSLYYHTSNLKLSPLWARLPFRMDPNGIQQDRSARARARIEAVKISGR